MNNLLVLSSYASQETIDGIIVDFFNSGFNGAIYPWLGNFILIILCLALSCLFGGLIGYEREIHGHAAGFRTHILISIGSSLIMIISGYATGESADPMRLAAAGVTGAGFLGAGTIIQNGFNVKGLTTAASIWVTVAIGMCVGAGYFVIGALATFVTILCLALFRKFEGKASKKNANVLMVANSGLPVLSILLDLADKHEITVKDVSSSLVKFNDKQYLRIVFKFYSTDKKLISAFLDDLKTHVQPLELKVLN